MHEGVGCVMLYVTKHAFFSSCFNACGCSTRMGWHSAHESTHESHACGEISKDDANDTQNTKQTLRSARGPCETLTDGSVAQDGDLARFRLRHLYLFPTTSISTCKRACPVWNKRNHMDLIRHCVTELRSLNGNKVISPFRRIKRYFW